MFKRSRFLIIILINVRVKTIARQKKNIFFIADSINKKEEIN